MIQELLAAGNGGCLEEGKYNNKSSKLSIQIHSLMVLWFRSSPTSTVGELRCPRCDSSNTKFCYYYNYISRSRAISARLAAPTDKRRRVRNVPSEAAAEKQERHRERVYGEIRPRREVTKWKSYFSFADWNGRFHRRKVFLFWTAAEHYHPVPLSSLLKIGQDPNPGAVIELNSGGEAPGCGETVSIEGQVCRTDSFFAGGEEYFIGKWEIVRSSLPDSPEILAIKVIRLEGILIVLEYDLYVVMKLKTEDADSMNGRAGRRCILDCVHGENSGDVEPVCQLQRRCRVNVRHLVHGITCYAAYVFFCVCQHQCPRDRNRPVMVTRNAADWPTWMSNESTRLTSFACESDRIWASIDKKAIGGRERLPVADDESINAGGFRVRNCNDRAADDVESSITAAGPMQLS
nr:dof zinc finger protein DOF1.1-like [Ipomoea batatas]